MTPISSVAPRNSSTIFDIIEILLTVASLNTGKCPAFIRWYNNNRVAAIYDPKKSISPVSLIVIAFEYAKIFLSLHIAHAKSMLTALNIRYFGIVIHKTHSWMTTYIAASPRFKNKFVEDLEKLGFNFHEMVELSFPHTYTNFKSSTINCECEFSKKVIPTFVFDFVAKMKTEACRGPKQVPSYVRRRITPSNEWLWRLEKDKRGNVVSKA